jgi:hypothetical protein
MYVSIWSFTTKSWLLVSESWSTGLKKFVCELSRKMGYVQFKNTEWDKQTPSTPPHTHTHYSKWSVVTWGHPLHSVTEGVISLGKIGRAKPLTHTHTAPQNRWSIPTQNRNLSQIDFRATSFWKCWSETLVANKFSTNNKQLLGLDEFSCTVKCISVCHQNQKIRKSWFKRTFS